jgi:hypothetical protein
MLRYPFPKSDGYLGAHWHIQNTVFFIHLTLKS